MLELNINNIDDLKKNLNKINFRNSLQKASGRSLIYLEGEAKKETPVDKSFLRNSYEIDNSVFGYWRLNNYRKYAKFVHDGHKQEVGRYVPAIGKRLVQPFVKGNPFMKRAGDKAKPRIIKIFEQETAHTIKTSNIWLRI